MWAQAINAVLGIWIMAAPGVLGYGGPAATGSHIAGPAIATFATVAMWEVTRGLRWLNVPLGLWLVTAPLVIDQPAVAGITSAAAGALVIGLSLVRGRLKHPYGGSWRSLWRDPESPALEKQHP